MFQFPFEDWLVMSVLIIKVANSAVIGQFWGPLRFSKFKKLVSFLSRVPD